MHTYYLSCYQVYSCDFQEFSGEFGKQWPKLEFRVATHHIFFHVKLSEECYAIIVIVRSPVNITETVTELCLLGHAVNGYNA